MSMCVCVYHAVFAVCSHYGAVGAPVAASRFLLERDFCSRATLFLQHHTSACHSDKPRAKSSDAWGHLILLLLPRIPPLQLGQRGRHLGARCWGGGGTR